MKRRTHDFRYRDPDQPRGRPRKRRSRKPALGDTIEDMPLPKRETKPTRTTLQIVERVTLRSWLVAKFSTTDAELRRQAADIVSGLVSTRGNGKHIGAVEAWLRDPPRSEFPLKSWLEGISEEN